MSSDTLDRGEAEKKLFDAIEDTRIGMLGVVSGPPKHMQPMTAFLEKDENALWFFTRRDVDIARDAGDGHPAMFCVISKDRDLWACLSGELSLQVDPERVERYWNPMVAAWYPEGKDDPALVLLRLELEDAQVWISEKGPVRMLFEVAKANLTKTLPDEGGQANIRFQ